MLLHSLRKAIRICRHPDHLAGMLLYDLVHFYGLSRALEIGALHKATSLYTAVALEERGAGQETVIDFSTPEDRVAALRDAAELLQLGSRLVLDLSAVSQHWRMLRLLQEGSAASFDLCFLSGRQTWLHAGFAIALAMKLLKPGGWLVLADAEYAYALDPSAPAHLVQGMSAEELEACQVGLVFEHFVARDTSFSNYLRAGKVLAAQRQQDAGVYSELHGRQALLQSRTIHASLKRSAFDPDFRRALLNAPQTTMEAIALQSGAALESDPDRFSGIHFHDREIHPMMLATSQRRQVHITLPDPVWQTTVTEAELERMVAVAQQRHKQSG